jgi:hypothetical protein
LALTLEYLEKEYYQMGLDSGVIPKGGRDEKFSCRFLRTKQITLLSNRWLGGSGSANFVVKPTFDFTVGGLFLLYRLSAILGFSTGLEDTGVRAYKGQAANLMSKPDLLMLLYRFIL